MKSSVEQCKKENDLGILQYCTSVAMGVIFKHHHKAPLEETHVWFFSQWWRSGQCFSWSRHGNCFQSVHGVWFIDLSGNVTHSKVWVYIIRRNALASSKNLKSKNNSSSICKNILEIRMGKMVWALLHTSARSMLQKKEDFRIIQMNPDRIQPMQTGLG